MVGKIKEHAPRSGHVRLHQGTGHMRELPSSHAAASTYKIWARKRSLLTQRIACLDKSRQRYRGTVVGISRKRGGKPRMIGGQFVVVHVIIHQLSVFPNTSHPMLKNRSELLHGNSTPSLNSLCIWLTPTQSLKALSNWWAVVPQAR
jgi:hypothetical protein